MIGNAFNPSKSPDQLDPKFGVGAATQAAEQKQRSNTGHEGYDAIASDIADRVEAGDLEGEEAFEYDLAVATVAGADLTIAVRLNDMSPEMRFERLNGLVKEAQRDGRIAWVLSAACLRRLIFPQSYNGKRFDDVRYKFTAKDEACGKPIYLDSLNPNHVKRFLSHAERMCPTIPLASITPITSDKTQ